MSKNSWIQSSLSMSPPMPVLQYNIKITFCQIVVILSQRVRSLPLVHLLKNYTDAIITKTFTCVHHTHFHQSNYRSRASSGIRLVVVLRSWLEKKGGKVFLLYDGIRHLFTYTYGEQRTGADTADTPVHGVRCVPLNQINGTHGMRYFF